jgi:hypothetical protein
MSSSETQFTNALQKGWRFRGSEVYTSDGRFVNSKIYCETIQRVSHLTDLAESAIAIPQREIDILQPKITIL